MERNRDFVYLDAFVWDTAKNERNKAKHGLSFEVASRIFSDPLLYQDFDYAHSDEEDRERFVGKIEGYYIITVIATDRNGRTRIISARRATKKEVCIYEAHAKTLQGY